MLLKDALGLFDPGIHPEALGVEVEMEFKDAYPMISDGVWRIDVDHSLKGWAAEYVSTPMQRDELEQNLQNLYELFKSSTPNPSIRCGVHIHMNVMHMEVKQIMRMFVVWFILENMLVKKAGPQRESNLSRLRVQDADYIVTAFEQALKKNNLLKLSTDNLRYTTLNPVSLFKYGTVESRVLATPKDYKKIVEWVDILLKVKEFSCKVDNIVTFLEQISMNDRAFVESVLGPDYEKYLYKGWKKDLWENMRLVQHICYLLEK